MARPNVLMVCVDHWPGPLLGRAGHPCIQTPTLDQIADSGVIFTNAYTALPSCVPARRSLMTGTTARTHGDRVFKTHEPMPKLPTLAQTFRDAGYQTYAVGKLHVFPQRDRIGFDDVVLNEEGRHLGQMTADDYEMFLADAGYGGQQFVHGMGNNQYVTRPWHLPESCHPTNWTAREMCRMIHRRDPTRPAFWFVSFNHPHPPLAPLRDYLNLYRDVEIDMPFVGQWAEQFDALPYALRVRHQHWGITGAEAIRAARRAFYAQCTHIDHQLRLVIGTLREEGLLDNTIILFTCDHGDMLGNHGLWAKTVFYEWAAKVPFILVPVAGDDRLGHYRRDDRLVELADVMPTLLQMCDIPVPSSVEGISLLSDRRREYLYGEHSENDSATRMIHDGRFKLIYYPVGNRFQLFDLQNDPCELRDLSDRADSAAIRARLTKALIKNLYGNDLNWLNDGQLVGLPDKAFTQSADRGLFSQRGWRFP